MCASPDEQDVLLRPRPSGALVPLATEQRLLWDAALEQGTRPSDQRLCAACIRIRGPLHEDALRASIDTVVIRHESLRTRIVVLDGIPRQIIDSAAQSQLTSIDVPASGDSTTQRAATDLAQEFLQRLVDVARGPLFEAMLLRLSDEEYVLVLALDHIVADAVSCTVLSREIRTLYTQLSCGLPASLPLLPVQFADYALWQEQTYETWLQQDGAYWRARFSGVGHIQLPVDRRVASGDPLIAMVHAPFGKALTDALRRLAAEHDVSLRMVVLAIYAVELSIWCQERDFVLAFASHGRHRRAELENIIGSLAHALCMRITLFADDDLIGLSRRLGAEFIAARAHQGFGRVPDFVPWATDAQFNWIPGWSLHRQEEWPSGLKVQPFPVQTLRRVVPRYKFGPIFTDTPAGIVATLRYRPAFFEASTIRRFAARLCSSAECLARHPAHRMFHPRDA
jgi:hypothetical protein